MAIDKSVNTLTGAEIVLKALQDQISDCLVTFYPGLGFHNIMVIQSEPFTKCLTPPNELIGEGIRKFMPDGDEFNDLIYIINQAQIILHNHPVNQKRKRENLDSANSIWLWGNGKKGTLPPFEKKFGKKFEKKVGKVFDDREIYILKKERAMVKEFKEEMYKQ